jgi:hypothetical protein
VSIKFLCISAAALLNYNVKIVNITCKSFHDYVAEPKRFGTWVDVDEKTYMFSFPNDMKTVFKHLHVHTCNLILGKKFEEALIACCQINLKLISLHQDFLYQTMADALKS